MTYSSLAIPAFLYVTASLLGACTGPDIFERVGAAESEDVAGAPYPRLSEVAPPAPGPDPATGDAVLIELGAAASEADEQLQSVSGPVQ